MSDPLRTGIATATAPQPKRNEPVGPSTKEARSPGKADKGWEPTAADAAFSAHGAKFVATFGNLTDALTPAGNKIAKAATVVALPFVAGIAYADGREAVRDMSDEKKVDKAVGSFAYFTSVASDAGKLSIEHALQSGKLTGPVSKAVARTIPGLSGVVAASDVTYASTVLRDESASPSKKIVVCLSATASVVAAAASFIPLIGTAGAAGASQLASGLLLASEWL